jgi:excisionase family DNA binding protein
MTSQERLWSVEKSSERLSVSTFTTRRLIKSGELRAVRVGRRLLVPESEISRVITEGCGKHAGQGMTPPLPVPTTQTKQEQKVNENADQTHRIQP